MASVSDTVSAQPGVPGATPAAGVGGVAGDGGQVPPAGYGYPAPASGYGYPVPAGAEQPTLPPAPRNPIGRFFAFLFVRQTWLAPLSVLACFGMAVVYVEHFNPTTGAAGPTGGCAFKALTGLDCPGCGGTRAFWYLLHGNLPEAARNHVLAVFAAPFVAYAYVAWALRRVFGITLPMPRIPSLALALFAGAWLAFFVLRNLPWAPFTYLYV
ncbi:hypothetical protein Athai_23840 [Actinocatenispora thailandica]|uniref:DUF2752 domain-containing protein n=1 Tax=Actinocatenispora thailandica TaxID=227318 RepID=A0A7R7HWL0_9ACTN|nr:DUF2752 domain-containing protein [Actinocatenispora thailandica]BCJ34881.1 hypothetical protein Athai_23840 [Actinocatenispora thailandica]